MVSGQRKLVHVRLLAVALLTLLLSGAADDARSAHEKLNALQHSHLPAGTRVSLSEAELRAWVRDEAPYWGSFGITNLRFTLGPNRATGTADVDFLKARKAATGEDAGWLMKNLFSGRRPVSVTARFSSAGGKGRVDVERVEVNGVAIDGLALDYLIQDYVKPNFPDARVSEWFPLDSRIERFSVNPAGVAAVIGK